MAGLLGVMTENKNQELITWVLNRVHQLKPQLPETHRNIQELRELLMAILPDQKERAKAKAMMDEALAQRNAQPTSLEHLLQEQMPNWNIEIKTEETFLGVKMLGQSLAHSTWRILARKEKSLSQGLHTNGSPSLTTELAAQSASLEEAIRDVIKQHAELKRLGLD